MIQATDLNPMGRKLWMSWLVVIHVLIAMLMFDNPISNTVTGSDGKRELILKDLFFDNGYFHQLIVPEGVDVLRANWAASITDGEYHVCSGGNNAPYERKLIPKKMTPDQWTGDSCDGLIVGQQYLASAIWEWRDAEGQTRQITKSFEFVYQEIVL